MRPVSHSLLVLALVGGALCAPGLAHANQGGANGFTGMPIGGQAGSTCNSCHNGGGTPTVTITGPQTINGGTATDYTLTVRGGAGTRGGVDIAVDSKYATLQNNSGSTALVFGEITHKAAIGFAGGAITVPFKLIGPSFGGTIHIYAAGLSANGNGATSGDAAGTTMYTVTVQAAPGAPVIDSVVASQTTVTNKDNTTVTVTALDDGGEPNLSYHWSMATGPVGATVTFATNDTNAAKSSVAKFSKAGDYTLKVDVTDKTNTTASGTVNVKLTAGPSSISLTPTTVGVPVNGTQQFTATLLDQFKTPIVPQPTFNWSLPLGGGKISPTGLFTAASVASGPFPLTVDYNGMGSAASVTVGNGTAPTFAKVPSGNINGMSANLSVLGSDTKGESSITYTWSVVSGPGDATFTPNGTNAAKATVASFTVKGTYNIGVLLKNSVGLTASGNITLNIDGTAGSGTSVENLPGAPSVPWLTPASSGLSLSGKAQVEVQASDDTGVSEVSFLVDGNVVAAASSSPYRAVIDTCQFDDGEHQLGAAAKDSSGTVGNAPALSIKIANNGKCGSKSGGSSGGGLGCTTSGGDVVPLTVAGLLLAVATLRRRRLN